MQENIKAQDKAENESQNEKRAALKIHRLKYTTLVNVSGVNIRQRTNAGIAVISRHGIRNKRAQA